MFSYTIDLYQLLQLIVGIFVTFILFKILKLFRKRWTLMEAMKPFPGPPSHWLYGHALEFAEEGDDLNKSVQWAKSYPYGHQVWIGPFTAFLAVYHPDYAKALLAISEPKDDVVYRFMLPWLGDGLLISSGQKWYRHRRLLTPGFHYDILKSYVQEIADSTRIMLDKWELLSTNVKSVELYHHLSLMTLDSILKCAFSYHSNCQIESHNSYIQAVYELGFLASHRFKVFHHHYDLIYYFSRDGYRFRKGCDLAHEHTDRVIRQRKEALKDEKEMERIKEKKHRDFLDILLCSKDENGIGLSDEDLRSEVDTFMFEGHDTTASGISWLLYCLAQHPEHQQKCREEIQELLDGSDEFKWEYLSTMPYTSMCLKESMRLYPPLPGLARKLTKPLVFPDGKQVPAGCLVALSLYCLHRNPMFWEKPEEFDPLRFSPENSESRHHHAFIPFSVGPRNCIGQHFAMNEMKVAIALILNRFELEVDPSKPPIKVSRLVLRSKNGIYLKIKKLEGKGKSGKLVQ
ncbi:cytochrome P450 4B1-like [Amblyraja radiata]|uniref:cytochrome P450 4B1-like n=1 Tax=Amblyraja radiata TaxID=386614 RepID=UPI0014040EFE|nr:cytochrome P450 4B1-like [Amblyraja radiata]